MCRDTLRNYLKLIRLHHAGLTAVAPVLGALAVGNTNIIVLAKLFWIGLLFHVFGFVLNDVIDVDIDRLSPNLQSRPLVNGTISIRAATTLAVTAGIFTSITMYYFFNFNATIVLICGLCAGAIYDLGSKKIVGMDIFVAFAIWCLILSGAIAITPQYTLLPPLAYIVATVGLLQVLAMNIIYGGLKDIDHDARGNGKTLALALGVSINKDNKLIVPKRFKHCAYMIESCHLSLAIVPLIGFGLQHQFIQLTMMLPIFIATILTLYRMLSIQYFSRQELRKRIGYYVSAAYLVAPIMLLSVHSNFIFYVVVGGCAVLPILWQIVSNLILYGNTLNPSTQ